MTVPLDPIQASRHLKITPELLHRYVRFGTKGKAGRKLTFIEDSGAQLFHPEELDAFDAWLAEPWANEGAARINPPQAVRDYLKVESGGICPCCSSSGPFEDAHIVKWSISRSNHHHNLLRLCVTCHERFDGGEIPLEEIQRHKEAAIQQVQSRFRESAEPRWPIRGAPPLTGRFFGRESELDAVVAALRSGHSLSLVGVGGIGKTQLVLHALKRAALDRIILWIGLDTMSSATDVAEILLSQARASGIDIRVGRPEFDGTRVCIIFDGLERVGENHDEALDLIPSLLAELNDTPVIVTSQVNLAGLDFAESITLGPLDPVSASNLLSIQDNMSTIDALLKFADGHPLTLTLLRVLVKHLGASETQAELARRGVAAVADPQRQSHSSQTSLKSCLQLAWSRLSQRERRLLWFVAASPGGFRP